jgi:hypothetical protein
MGLGDNLLGEGLLGEDDIARGVADGTLAPRAIRFNPLTRNFDIDENGRFTDEYPVDNAVSMALFMEQQKLGSAPETGQTLRKIPSPIGKKVGSDVRNRVQLALKHLTDRGDIRIVQIKHEAKNRHTLFVSVEYINLRLQPPNNTRTKTLTL